MSAFNQSSVWPLYGAAGLSLIAIIFTRPEPLAGGWEWATLAASMLGVLASMPFWQAAQAGEIVAGRSGVRGLFMALFAGILATVTLLHLANAVLPPGPARTEILTVTDKYVTRRSGRGSSKRYNVVTTPVPGETDSRTVHRPTGLYGSRGGYASYSIGGCMALRWRPGWMWPVVASRTAAPCDAGTTAPDLPDGTSTLPLARVGPAWTGIQQRLSRDVAALPLPPQGVRVEFEVTAGADGGITAMKPLPGSPALSPIATDIVSRAVIGKPGALREAGTYRLWLLLRAAG
jgi:hypothetical protein